MNRQLTSLALTALLLATFALLGCGSGSGDILPPPDDDPDPPADDPGLPTGEVKGKAIYAVDLDNRLLLFGTESPGTIARVRPITGLPFLKRIVGLDFRPSNGKLYGVGNDSRVYIIDTLTAAATPVGSGPFTPQIASFFDIHFGMGFDPVTERIRLISAEGGMNWSINPDDGTAVRGGTPHYAAGDPNEGKRIKIAGLAYVPMSASASAATLRRGSASLAAGPNWILEAIDAENGVLGEFIDVETGEFIGLGPIDSYTGAACTEVKFDGDVVWAVFQATTGSIGAFSLVAYPTRSAVIKYVAGQIGTKVAGDVAISAIQAFAISRRASSGSESRLVLPAQPELSPMIASELTARARAAPNPQTECTSADGN